MATPPGYEPDADIVAQADELAAISVTVDRTIRRRRSADADAVYTDVWASMGPGSTKPAERRAAFRPYQVNESLFALAAPDAIFMHCLPAKRGEEVTDEVMESPRSVVFDQAENRLHVQKALLLMLLG